MQRLSQGELDLACRDVNVTDDDSESIADFDLMPGPLTDDQPAARIDLPPIVQQIVESQQPIDQEALELHEEPDVRDAGYDLSIRTNRSSRSAASARRSFALQWLPSVISSSSPGTWLTPPALSNTPLR